MTTTSSDIENTSARIGQSVFKRFDKIMPSASYVEFDELIDLTIECAQIIDDLESLEIGDYIMKMILLGNEGELNLDETKLAGKSDSIKRMRQKKYYRARKQFLRRKREEFQRSIAGKRAKRFKQSSAGKYFTPIRKDTKKINRSKGHTNLK